MRFATCSCASALQHCWAARVVCHRGAVGSRDPLPLRSSATVFCGYSMPHPSEPLVNVRLQTRGVPAVDVFRRGLESLIVVAEEISSTFSAAVGAGGDAAGAGAGAGADQVMAVDENEGDAGEGDAEEGGAGEGGAAKPRRKSTKGRAPR